MYVLRIILVFVPFQMAKKGWLRNARENSKKETIMTQERVSARAQGLYNIYLTEATHS